MPADREGLGHPLENPIGDQRRVALVSDILEEHGELVASEAGDRVPRSEEPFQLPSERGEQLIARGMPQAVVDVLEAVDVEEEDGEGIALAPAGDAEGAVQPVLEESPAGKVREPVEEGVAEELLLRLLPLGDVGQRPRNPVRLVRPAPDGQPTGQHPPVGAVPLAQAVLELEVGGPAVEMRAELGVEPLGLVGMHPAEPLLRSRADLVPGVSQHLFPAGREVELAAPQVPIP